MHRTLASSLASLWLLCACSSADVATDPSGGAGSGAQAGAGSPGSSGAGQGGAGGSGGSLQAGAGGTAGSAGAGAAGAGGSGAGAAGAGGSGAGAAGAAPGPAVSLVSVEVAQTHVLPEAGLSWKLKDEENELHLVGQRSFFALVDLGAQAPASPVLEVLLNGEVQGSVPLDPPSSLPPTEDKGPAYAANRHSATVEAGWVKPGMSLRVTASGFSPSSSHTIKVGADIDFDMWSLPFYLFGASDENAPPISETSKPDTTSQAELIAKWPVARVNFANHPATRVDWPYIIIGPRKGNPAMRVNNKDEQKDGFAIMSAVLDALSAFRNANGEGSTNNHYYAPLMMLDASGKYSGPGGGLGGGSRGTGDHTYGGIFIHEQGHAFGMPHAGEAFDKGEFPYPGGSLLGSVWGFDAGRGEFLAPFLPGSADSFGKCQADPDRQKDAQGRCVKQDPMQSGSGDQAEGYKYTMFSDFNAAVIQDYFEGDTVVEQDGSHSFKGGTVFVDPASPTGYSRWDSVDLARVPVAPETTEKGLYGFNRGLPEKRGVPVHAIVFSLSNTGAAGVSQIYPPVSFTGNLLRQVDPTVPEQLAGITPNTSDVPWYCHASGCDYTLRVTYADGSRRHVLLQGGFRGWFKPMDAPGASASDPLSGDSYRVFGVNVPGDQPLDKIEVLETPMGWGGLPAEPKVILSR